MISFAATLWNLFCAGSPSMAQVKNRVYADVSIGCINIDDESRCGQGGPPKSQQPVYVRPNINCSPSNGCTRVSITIDWGFDPLVVKDQMGLPGYEQDFSFDADQREVYFVSIPSSGDGQMSGQMNSEGGEPEFCLCRKNSQGSFEKIQCADPTNLYHGEQHRNPYLLWADEDSHSSSDTDTTPVANANSETSDSGSNLGQPGEVPTEDEVQSESISELNEGS